MALTSVFCPNCGAANESAFRNCFACGSALEDAGKAAARLELVQQRYRLVRQVGTGGFGAVYRAEDTFANRQVALKCINLAGLKPQEMIEATDAFNREVSLLPGLRHTSLPRVYDHFTDPEHWYLVMEFIEGETLEAYVQKMPGERLTVEMVIDIGIRLAEVLHYLHSRQPAVIFRDLKPANIMRTPGGNLYLIDFGIARVFKPGQARDTIAFGSPGYAPPEQYGKAQTTPRADLYSLGATLHALLSGSDPANSPFAFAPLTLSSQPAIEHLERLIEQMVQLDTSKRPTSARAVKEELQEIATELLQERLRVLYPVNTPPTHSFVPPYVPPSAAGSGSQQGQIQIGLSAQAASAARRGKSRRRFIRLSAGTLLAAAIGGGAIQLLNNFSEHSSQLIISATGDESSVPFGTAKLGTTYYTYTGHSNFVSSVAWSPDGNSIVSSGYDFTAQVIRAFPATLIHTYREPLRLPVLAVAWSPDNQYIASVAGSTVWIWHALTGKVIREYSGHSEQVNAITWSPDGRYIASAAENVHVWNSETGEYVNTYTNHTGRVNAVAWSPDSNSIVSGGKDGTVQVWQPFQANPPLIYRKHVDQVNCVCWSLDNQLIASGGSSNDRAAHVWYARNGETLHVRQNKSMAVRAAVFSPTTMRIASTGDDDSVQIWDATDGQGVFTYQNDSSVVTSISWSPDGSYIVSGSADSTVQVWQAI